MSFGEGGAGAEFGAQALDTKLRCMAAKRRPNGAMQIKGVKIEFFRRRERFVVLLDGEVEIGDRFLTRETDGDEHIAVKGDKLLPEGGYIL